MPVYRCIDPALAGRIVNLWQRYGLLRDEQQAERRLDQVVCVAFDPFGELAAVNSVRPCELNGQRYLSYKIFIRPKNGEPALKFAMSRTALDVLKSCAWDDPPAGILVILSNPKLERDDIRDQLLLAGFRVGGTNPRGRTIWLHDFPSPGR